MYLWVVFLSNVLKLVRVVALALIFKASLNGFGHGMRTISDVALNLLQFFSPHMYAKLVMKKIKI